MLPGRLAISRAFGDIEAKSLAYGGKPGVIIAEPEIKAFKYNEDEHDLIVLGCDGIFDVLTNVEVRRIVWATIKSECKQGVSMNNHQVKKVIEKAAENVVKASMMANSTDNVSCIIVFFLKAMKVFTMGDS